MTKSAPRGCSRPATISYMRVNLTLSPVSSRHSRTAASAGSSPPSTKPAGRVHKPRKGSLTRRTRSTRPSCTINTAAATFGSTKWIHPHCRQTGRTLPNRSLCTTDAPQRGQKLNSEGDIKIEHGSVVSVYSLPPAIGRSSTHQCHQDGPGKSGHCKKNLPHPGDQRRGQRFAPNL